jgi:hypothetical protein
MRAARPATALFCTVAFAVGVAGCGGSELDYQEVPGPPTEVAIPSETVEAGGSAGADATPTPTATPEPGSTTAPSDQSGATGTAPSTGTGTASTGDTGTTGTSGTDSGGATAPAQEDSATNDSAPPAGSEAQQFEDFCAQNPGAC